MRRTSISCTAFILTLEKNQPRIGANPASLWLAPRIGFAYPHFRNTASLSCSSLIGIVRANPVAAPAAPMRKRLREQS